MDNADTVVILSSQLISQIVEQYFNSTMFRQSVEIVDLQPTEKGYLFSIVFKDTALMQRVESAPKQMTNQEMYEAVIRQRLEMSARDTKNSISKSTDMLGQQIGAGPSVQDMLQMLEDGENNG